MAASRKNADRRATRRLARWLTTVTVMPPRAAPIGIIPHAKKRYTLLTLPSRCGGMIDCRKLTVITFHVAPRVAPMPYRTITIPQCDDSPTRKETTALEPSVIARQVPLPRRFDIH